MSLHKTLNHIVAHYKSDIAMIRDFVGSTYETLDDLGKILEKHKHEVTNEDAKALRAFAELLKEAADQTSSRRKKAWSKRIEITSKAEQMVLLGVKNIKSKGFLAEMALAYMISFQEGFAKDYLGEVLSKRPELVRSGKNLSHEDVLKFTSITKLRRHIASIETDNLGRGSIDDVGLYLQKKLI